ncbi:caspase recruitment domain-containing protein 9 isoform X2 [Sus scrofa]|uniref:caspase recruitment domain-containing protein 9 isoform X2 n=1 Tax=Sus scrofa TaxID=9823 RepID=UPI000A2B533F|nr:caspase recruitment domain-containing protein 9 isoform X2 [Sus scrofa]
MVPCQGASIPVLSTVAEEMGRARGQLVPSTQSLEEARSRVLGCLGDTAGPSPCAQGPPVGCSQSRFLEGTTSLGLTGAGQLGNCCITSHRKQRKGWEWMCGGMRKSRVAWPAARSAPARTMSDYENEDECWSGLEGFRVKLISVIDPARITPYLRQCKVLSPDDEEQVLSDPSLVIRKRKVGVLLDILQRTGHKGYVAFLESLELYYPQLYKKVTGKEPTRVFSVIIDASGESGLTQLLMSEVMKLQKKAQDLTALLGSKDDLIKELRVKDGLLRKHQERAQRLKEACEAGGRELQRCKDENYDLALRLARQSEERGTALMRNRDLQLEIDRLKHSLMKAEDDCSVERKHTLKLRHAMEQRPSQELLWELQQEKALLQARVQGLEASVQVLEEDWRQAQRDLQEQTRTVFSLRKDLRQAEAQRARCLEEKEVFELQCLALRKDSKMYKDRIEAILRQMEEVAVERDQAIVTREELHAQQARSLQEKDVLRKQVRELSEKVDELQLQLFQREGQLLALEDRLRRQQLDTPVLSSDLEDSSPRSSQELSLPRDLEEDAQLSDRGGPAIEESLEQQKERLSLTPTVRLPGDTGTPGGTQAWAAGSPRRRRRGGGASRRASRTTAGSGPSGRCSTARGRGRWTGRTPRAATTPTPRAPSRPLRPAAWDLAAAPLGRLC